MKPKIIIDTDPGCDDALAIMLLEKSNKLEIKAITTVAGNSNIQNVTNNAQYILNLINAKIPVYSGASTPLNKPLIEADVQGEKGLGELVVTNKETLTGNAVDKIISIVRENPGEISILAIGPQTNIAQAFIKDTELPALIKQLIIMGGAITVPGNKNRVAEFNFFVDPEAASVVLKSAAKKILFPLDICNDAVLKFSNFQKLKGSEIFEPVMKMMGSYIRETQLEDGVDGAIMYDPLAAYYLINPDAFTLEPADIEIETTSELTRGMSVVDRRNMANKNFNIEVATKVDMKKFTKDFISLLY